MAPTSSEIKVDTATVETVAQNITKAASPITACLDGLSGVSVSQPGFATADATVAAAQKWATTLRTFSSGFAGFGQRVLGGARTYTVVEDHNRNSFMAH